MAPAEARQALRVLLRAIDRSITAVKGDTKWRQFAVAEFRARGGEGPEAAAAAAQRARDYAFLINSLREHKELLESYNIGLDSRAREEGQHARAAGLVGLALPKVHTEGDGDGAGGSGGSAPGTASGSSAQ